MESLSILLTLIRPLIQTSFDVSLHWNWRRRSWNIRSSQEELRLLSICHQDQLAVLSSRAGSMRITQVAQYDTSLSRFSDITDLPQNAREARFSRSYPQIGAISWRITTVPRFSRQSAPKIMDETQVRSISLSLSLSSLWSSEDRGRSSLDSVKRHLLSPKLQF